jgi:hypothetical protein
MSLFFKLPQRFKFNSPTVIFRGAFNNPTVGVYDFTPVIGNTQTLFTMERNSVYLIDRMAIGGNISEETYLNSIDSTAFDPPNLQFRTLLTGEGVFTQKIPVVNYYNDRQATVFVSSDKGSDALTVQFSGRLNQIADTVGKAEIDIFLTLSIYEIALTDFKIWFENKITM